MGYLLLAPAVFLLGPLLGLLLVSRPRSRREWIWVPVCVGWLALWLGARGDLADQALRAFGVLVTGSFLGITLARPEPRPAFSGAVLAALAAVAALALWCVALGLSWRELEGAIARNLTRTLERMALELDGSAGVNGAGREGMGRMLRQMTASAPAWAALAPGFVFLEAVAGQVLAWALYHQVARSPLGRAPGPFSGFRFSDQTVWLPVAGLALLLAPGPKPLADLGGNLLLVALGLYAARGLAVARSVTGRLSRAVAVAAGLAVLIFFPFVLGGLVLLGLTDTWVDFRRRLAPGGGHHR